MERDDGRAFDEIRPVRMELHYVDYPEGSVFISLGDTKVLCNVTIEDTTPKWMVESGTSQGWITAEYSLLPRSTHRRTDRETTGLRGRTQEIRRMIGRSLRAAIDLQKLGERTCIVDCDVVQADGGTRTAAITGGYVALVIALNKLIHANLLSPAVLLPQVAAISVGSIADQRLLDLTYLEDSNADVDLNVVMNAEGNYIEIQGNAERETFSQEALVGMLALARSGIEDLFREQRRYLEDMA